MRKDALEKRIKQLSSLEFINVFLLPVAFLLVCYVSRQRIGLNSIIAMIINAILLLEGSYFWYIINRRLLKIEFSGFYRIFETLKKVNLIIIPLCLIVILVYPFSSSYDR